MDIYSSTFTRNLQYSTQVHPLTSTWKDVICLVVRVTPHEVVDGHADIGLLILFVLLLNISDVQPTCKKSLEELDVRVYMLPTICLGFLHFQ